MSVQPAIPGPAAVSAGAAAPAVEAAHGLASRRRVVWSLIALIELVVIGYALSGTIASQPIGQFAPESNNIFYRLYGLHEGPFFALTGFFLLGAIAIVLLGRRTALVQRPFPSWVVPVLAILTTALAWFGARYVLHGLAFSMDEFNAVFQSRIFASGQIGVDVPEEWRGIMRGVAPYFVTYRPDEAIWLSSYLPVYAAFRALFVKAGIAALTNPFLGAASLFTITAVARRVWPEARARIALPALLLVTSSQFIAMSMSSYAMPAHLLINLGWLGLYVRQSRRSLIVAPWVGVLALGLHNPFPHALFVAPFLWRILRTRGRAWAAYYFIVYGAGSALWAAWLNFSFDRPQGIGMLDVFGVPGLKQLVTQVMSLSLVASWQTPILVIGLAVALGFVRSLSQFERDLALGFVLTFGFYFLFSVSQGHGWGYRYIYAVFGNVVLLATSGLVLVERATGGVWLRRLLVTSIALTVLVQFPLRALQIRRFVHPFASSIAYVRSSREPVVLLHTGATWYGQDLVRNDPFFNPPVIVSASSRRVSAIEWHRFGERFGDRMRRVRPAELESFGLPQVRPTRDD